MHNKSKIETLFKGAVHKVHHASEERGTRKCDSLRCGRI